VVRNSAVIAGIRFDAIIPKITTNPEAIPIKLIATCTCVNTATLIPKIMGPILS
jgi:hypothetical protein